MKFVEPSQFADPDVAARKLVEIANGIEAVQEGRIYIERSTARSSKLAPRRTSIAPIWPARSPWAGCGDMRAGPT
jgi:hypothetical protein